MTYKAPEPTATNHIRAGKIQIPDGEFTAGSFNVTGNITEDIWESVGPTGSGADNIWTALDNLPAEATILRVRAAATLNQNSSSVASLVIYMTNGDDATPVESVSNRVLYWATDGGGDVGQTINEWEILIPLGPTNQDFQVHWADANSSATTTNLYYKGFYTD